jgi:hypothetical protein
VTTFTPEFMAEQRKLTEKASERPWEYCATDDGEEYVFCGPIKTEYGEYGTVLGKYRDELYSSVDGVQIERSDWEYATAAANHYPAALDEIEKSHKLSAAMADAIFYLGGGDIYLEEFGRLCFCFGCGFGEHKTWNKGIHATTCDDLWLAWKKYTHEQLKVTA